MQPLYLVVRGMRPWKTDPPTEIAFLGAKPIVIVGEGRVDEASIQRVIAYAVHGETPCGDRGLRTLMNEESPRMRVNLVFWAHRSAWEVIRGITRLRNGAVVSSCILNRVGEDARVRGVRRVNHRLGELLERDNGSAGYPPRAAIRCPSPRQSPHDGAAHGEAATTDHEIALLWECLAAVGRESDAVRREAARVADATAAAELARARHQQSRACARLTDEGQPVEVRQREGVTDHLHPESCAGRCEAAGEALTGARTGRATEHRKVACLECRDRARG